MDRTLVRTFWGCGDTYIVDFAIARARLNKVEREVVQLAYDDCLTQEQTAEKLNISTRSVQKIYASATDKLLSIPWLVAYAKELKSKEQN